jgi:hypothetical protein
MQNGILAAFTHEVVRGNMVGGMQPEILNNMRWPPHIIE